MRWAARCLRAGAAHSQLCEADREYHQRFIPQEATGSMTTQSMSADAVPHHGHGSSCIRNVQVPGRVRPPT
eukprot:contig_9809_g2343